MATSTIFNFNFNNSEIVDSTGQWYNATTGTPTTEFIEHDGNTALLQRAYIDIAGTAYTRDINPVFFQSRDPTFTAHTYTIELQLYPLRDPGGANFGPETGPVLDFNPATNDAESRVQLRTIQYGSASNTFYWKERYLGLDGDGIPFLTVTAADGTYNRWYSIRIERVDDGTNTGATIKIYVDGTLVVNETLTYAQDARIGRIGDSIRYTYRRNSTDPQGAGAAIDNFKLTAGIAPSRVVDVSLANLQRNNANLLSFIKGKVPTVNDGTLTIQRNGTNVATFTANASTNATANITVPTAVSELANDSGYLTASSNLDASKLTSGTVDIERLPQGALERLVKVANEAARYALTTADVQLGDTVQQLDTGIMYVVTDTDHLDSAAGYTEYTAGTAASVPWSGVTGKPTFAAVATSGAYSDLTGTPTIPTVNNATLTIQRNGTTVDTFTANASVDKTINISTTDDTKIPLAGSNQISGDLIPSTDGTVNLGGPSYQWNNAYIKSLTINGVATGDILTHNASEFVDLATAQTIGGVKTFSDGLFASKSTAGDLAILEDNSINSTNEDANGMPLTGHTNSIKIKGSQFNVVPCMLTGQVFASGNTSAELRVYKYKDTSRTASFNIHYTYSNDTAVAQFINCNISTNVDGLYNIGSSARRFNTAYVKAINNLNPGALSLPSDAYIDVDTTNWDLTCQNGLLGSFTPTADGWLMLSVDNSGTSEVNFWVIGGVLRINNKSTLNTSDNNNFNMITIPVTKGTTYNIYGNASEYVAGRSIAYCRFMPCRGNS